MKTVVVDVGGTAMKSGLFEDGILVSTQVHPTPADKSASSMLQATVDVIRNYTDFDRIGISTTGLVDVNTGTLIYSNGIMEPYTGAKIKETLQAVFGVPVQVENDSNCATLGEAVAGSGQEFSDFLCISYGTGIGGGIIIQKKLYYGTGFSAGEFGALLTHSDQTVLGDPWAGSYEENASTTALVRKISRRFPELKNGKEIFAHADKPEVFELIKEWAWEVSLGLISLIHIFNPEGIVLGGGVMEQPILLDIIRGYLDAMLMPGFRHVKIVQASLGNKAGMYGAASLFESGTGT